LGYAYTQFHFTAKFAVALETAIKFKLYSVITKTFKVSRALVERRLLLRNVNIISLDNCNPKPISSTKIQMARDIAARMGSQIWMANDTQVVKPIDQNSDQMKNVLQDIFGDTIICENIDIARKIAFDPNIRLSCVTLNGDVVKSNGMMSGGYNAQINTAFRQWINFQKISKEQKEADKLHAK
jgi:structural maintenance of chromosome 2